MTLFRQQPGADRKLGAVRSDPPSALSGTWAPGGRSPRFAPVKRGWRVYAKATPKVGDGFVCRARDARGSGKLKS